MRGFFMRTFIDIYKTPIRCCNFLDDYKGHFQTRIKMSFMHLNLSFMENLVP